MMVEKIPTKQPIVSSNVIWENITIYGINPIMIIAITKSEIIWKIFFTYKY